MNSSHPPWTIVGQGLAGTCLAWEFWKRGVNFRLLDRGHGGSSRVAAGLVNPITGKNFEPSSRIADFHPVAMEFYREIEKQLQSTIWHPLPILRLADTEKEWAKMISKSSNPETSPWIADGTTSTSTPGWMGALELRGGGRLDTRTFLDQSRDFFTRLGLFEFADVPDDLTHTIRCEGAAGLIAGKLGPHRCAKGEILTFHAPDGDSSHIRIGAGGWMVPLGNHTFKAGSTYDWDHLDETPSEAGRTRIEQIIQRLGGGSPIEILAHEAGIRPIIRRSEPLIGPHGNGSWVFNGLGSKGSLYAPGVAKHLADWMLDGTEPGVAMDFSKQPLSPLIPPS